LNLNALKKGSKTVFEIYKEINYERQIEYVLKTGDEAIA